MSDQTIPIVVLSVLEVEGGGFHIVNGKSSKVLDDKGLPSQQTAPVYETFNDVLLRIWDWAGEWNQPILIGEAFAIFPDRM